MTNALPLITSVKTGGIFAICILLGCLMAEVVIRSRDPGINPVNIPAIPDGGAQ